MKVRITASDLGELTLNETDTTASIVQNILVLLNTWKGAVPLFRDFGLSPQIRHKPINVAKVMLISEIQEAIETYEPRATVLNIFFEADAGDPSILIPGVEVEF